MATIQAPSFNCALFQGTYGNASMEESIVDLNAAEDGTEIQLLSLPEGIRIYMFVLVTDGLGEGVTVTLKVGDIPVSLNNGLADAGVKTVGMIPFDIPTDSVLTAVINGSATGRLCVMALYKSVGTD